MTDHEEREGLHHGMPIPLYVPEGVSTLVGANKS